MDGDTALHIAASCGSLARVNDLLEVAKLSRARQLDLNALDKYKRTPLILACVNVPYPDDVIRALVKAGCDVNMRDFSGRTALHYVTGRGLNLAPLLEGGADPYIRDSGGNTSLHLAASMGAVSSVEAILAVGSGPDNIVNLNAGNDRKQTPLILACTSAPNPDGIVKVLIKAGCDVNTQDIDGRTALHYASARGMNLRSLLKGGAELNVCDNQGNTALHMAASGGFFLLSDLFIKRCIQLVGRCPGHQHKRQEQGTAYTAHHGLQGCATSGRLHRGSDQGRM